MKVGKVILNGVRWFFGIIFLFAVLGTIVSDKFNLFGFLFNLIIALLLIPPTYERIKKNLVRLYASVSLEGGIKKYEEYKEKMSIRKKQDKKETKENIEKNKKQKEINNFFEALKRKKKEIFPPNYGVFLDDTNYNLFYSFINSANMSLDILSWRVDEKLLSELLWFLKDKNIIVKVITKNSTNKGYLNKFKKYCSNLKLEVTYRNKIHGKLIILDDKYLALGSSNITNASMSESGHFLDCNVISQHNETVESAIDLFKSILNNKDYNKKIQDSRFLYSRNGEEYLPFLLKPYFVNETKEIILLCSCNMVDKRIINRIIQWNPKTSIKLYVSDTWSKNELSKDNLKSMEWLYNSSLNQYKNVKVIPIKNSVHSKLYLFFGQNKAIVSSQNLTVESWQSLLETGIIINEKMEIRYLIDTINSFKKSQLDKIEGLEKTSKPESSFSGSKSELSIDVPWELPESNSKWKIPRTRNQQYFTLFKHKIKKEKLFDGSRGREQTIKTIKNPLMEELESKRLSRESFTGIYSKPTRSLLTGKLSKEKKIRRVEKELEYWENKYKIEPTEKNKEAVEYYKELHKKQLEE